VPCCKFSRAALLYIGRGSYGNDACYPRAASRRVIVCDSLPSDVGLARLRYVLVQFSGCLITQGAQPFYFAYQCQQFRAHVVIPTQACHSIRVLARTKRVYFYDLTQQTASPYLALEPWLRIGWPDSLTSLSRRLQQKTKRATANTRLKLRVRHQARGRSVEGVGSRPILFAFVSLLPPFSVCLRLTEPLQGNLGLHYAPDYARRQVQKHAIRP
jgi:hypothetical protein